MEKQNSQKNTLNADFEVNILDGLADPVMLIGENREFIDGNQAAFSIVGKGSIGHDLASILDCPVIVEAIGRVLQGGPSEKGRAVILSPMPHHLFPGVCGKPTITVGGKWIRQYIVRLHPRVVHPERPLFTSQKGGEFTAQGIVMLLGRIYHEAGITGANFHSARVSFASRLAVRGISVFVLRQLMSHEDISTTSGYVTTGIICLLMPRNYYNDAPCQYPT